MLSKHKDNPSADFHTYLKNKIGMQVKDTEEIFGSNFNPLLVYNENTDMHMLDSVKATKMLSTQAFGKLGLFGTWVVVPSPTYNISQTNDTDLEGTPVSTFLVDPSADKMGYYRSRTFSSYFGMLDKPIRTSPFTLNFPPLSKGMIVDPEVCTLIETLNTGNHKRNSCVHHSTAVGLISSMPGEPIAADDGTMLETKFRFEPNYVYTSAEFKKDLRSEGRWFSFLLLGAYKQHDILSALDASITPKSAWTLDIQQRKDYIHVATQSDYNKEEYRLS